MSNILAIIPARDGSKEIPRKNIKLLNGIPLIAHSIIYAKSSSLINKIVVTTDSKEIKNIALKYNANIIDRPKKISGDFATTESAIDHALNQLNDKPDIIVLLQPTSPLRPNNSLDDALNLFIKNKYDSLLSISPTHRFFWKISSDKKTVIPEYNYKKRPQRQNIKDKDVLYIENGSLYIFTYKHFSQNKNRLGGVIGYTIFPEEYSMEIDSELDFILMEKISKLFKL